MIEQEKREKRILDYCTPCREYNLATERLLTELEQGNYMALGFLVSTTEQRLKKTAEIEPDERKLILNACKEANCPMFSAYNISKLHLKLYYLESILDESKQLPPEDLESLLKFIGSITRPQTEQLRKRRFPLTEF